MDALVARAQSRLAEAQIRVRFQGDEAGLSAALRRLRQDEAVADVEPELIASGAPQEAIEGITRELRDQAGAAFDANEAAKKLEDQLARTGRSGGAAGARAAARGMDQLRRAQEKAAAEAAKLETATRDALANYAADALESRDEIAQAFQSGFKGLEDALVRFVRTGKANFRDLANAIIADLARIAIRRAITGPLAQALGNALGGGFPAAPAAPAGFASATGLYHEGGVATAGPSLPGLKANEVAAVLEEGEAVLTSDQARALAGYRANAQARARAEEIIRIAARYHAGGVAGHDGHEAAPAANANASAARPAAPAAPQSLPKNLNVNIENSGGPKQAASADLQIDGAEMVVNIVMRDISEGGRIARAMAYLAKKGRY